MPLRHIAGVLVAGLIAVGANGSAQAADTVLIESNFTTGLDGWTSDVPSDVSWASTGGKPGGYVRFQDSVNGDTFIFAPADYFPKFQGLAGIGKIVFFHKVIDASGISSFVPYEVRLSGPGGAATWTGQTPIGPEGWVKIVVPLKVKAWTVTSGTFKRLLNNVTSFSIEIELGNGSPDVEGIDHVQLITTGTPASPAPPTNSFR